MLSTDFKEFIELLNFTQVEYMVVGGYALASYGHPRFTGDIDIWVNPSPPNIQKLIDVLGTFGFASLGLKESDFLVPEAVIQLGYPPARIDLLTAIDGVTFLDCFARRNLTEIDNIEISVIDVNDFKINKQATGRHKDLADLEVLNSTKV
ncbi:MAG: hypothetical protein QM533_02370 [Cytophagales bacterium]|nr:hypothetical protein [Cytophagales bacterium]